jgi:SAM-dependent methyltransferase
MVAGVSGETPCPRCAAGSRFLLRPRDRMGAVLATVRVCRSRACGVGFTVPPPSEVAAAPAVMPGREVEDRLAARVVAAGLRRFMDRLPPGALVVDAGAGSGLRARVLAEHGFRVVAAEPDPVEEARAHAMMAGLLPGGVEVVRAGVADLPAVLARRRADGVLLWHVLEHLHDIDAGLASIASVLAPGGVLQVAVPNRASAEAQVFGPRWHGWEPARHRWHLDGESLRIVLGAAGLAVEDLGTRGGWGYPSGLAFSVAPDLDPQVNPRRALAGRALAAALMPVAAAARLTGRGGQLVATARSVPG